MAKMCHFTIDGLPCTAEEGSYIIDAARQNHIYIPTLCDMEGVPPKGSCRMCTVRVNGKLMTSCTTRVSEGLEVENNEPGLIGLRKSIVELLFAEGNHLCPACEKSGSCELQALAYRFSIAVPRFPYLFQKRNIDYAHPKIIKDHNRCILCKRCVRAIKDENGKSIFTFRERGINTGIYVDPDLADSLTDELAQKAVDICPVGALMRRDSPFGIPIGRRKYDLDPIGSDIERKAGNDDRNGANMQSEKDG